MRLKEINASCRWTTNISAWANNSHRISKACLHKTQFFPTTCYTVSCPVLILTNRSRYFVFRGSLPPSCQQHLEAPVICCVSACLRTVLCPYLASRGAGATSSRLEGENNSRLSKTNGIKSRRTSHKQHPTEYDNFPTAPLPTSLSMSSYPRATKPHRLQMESPRRDHPTFQ